MPSPISNNPSSCRKKMTFLNFCAPTIKMEFTAMSVEAISKFQVPLGAVSWNLLRTANSKRSWKNSSYKTTTTLWSKVKRQQISTKQKEKIPFFNFQNVDEASPSLLNRLSVCLSVDLGMSMQRDRRSLPFGLVAKQHGSVYVSPPWWHIHCRWICFGAESCWWLFSKELTS